jgi:hypothetical protein
VEASRVVAASTVPAASIAVAVAEAAVADVCLLLLTPLHRSLTLILARDIPQLMVFEFFWLTIFPFSLFYQYLFYRFGL